MGFSLTLRAATVLIFYMPRTKKLDLEALLIKIVELMVRHQPSTLSFSKISRLTGVPRSTLYYYFGSSRDKMLEEAVRFGMKGFVQLATIETSNAKTWDEFQGERLKIVASLIKNYPWSVGLYFRYRNDQGKFGENIRDIEGKYVEMFGKAWKKYVGKDADVASIRISGYLKLGLMWGLATDRDFWFDQSDADEKIDKVVAYLNTVVTDIMKTKIR